MANTKPSARHRVRRYLLQALYQWQMTEEDPLRIEIEYLEEMDPKKVDIDYFHDAILGVVQNLEKIDEEFSVYCDRTVAELDAIERAILRLSTYELLHRLDVPYRVVINEALELAKAFGAEDSHKYVNGVLDHVAKKVRRAEVSERR